MLAPHGHLQQNGGSQARHTSEHTQIQKKPVSHSQPSSWLLCLHIWGFRDGKMNTHPSFPYPSSVGGGWGGVQEPILCTLLEENTGVYASSASLGPAGGK